MTAKEFTERLQAERSPVELKKYERYFPVGQRAGDEFMGVRMGTVFQLAKEFRDMPVPEIEQLLESPVHEVRAGALSIMGKSAAHAKTAPDRLKELYALYLRRHDRINNWDLVDLAAHHVVGRYLADKPRDVLYTLARSKNTWERRTAMVATAHFLKRGEVMDTFKLAALLVHDREESIHKATGWMLRFAGDVDRPRLLAFLDTHAATMPRTLLRATLEHLDSSSRAHYMSLKAKTP